jgi:UDP-glucose 4-epimerase
MTSDIGPTGRFHLKRVLITGVSGYIGKKFASLLAEKSGVEEITGIDIVPPSQEMKKLHFVGRDVRESIDDVLRERRIDTVVHTAFVLPPLHDVGLMEDININGTRNVFESSFRCGVKRILYTSSSTAYGFHPDNPVPLTEENPLRGNDDFTYSKSKRIIEKMIAGYRTGHPETAITVLRPCFVVGPGFRNPLAEHLQKRIVLLPAKTHPMQFVHEDDLIAIMYLVLKKGKGGVYNVGGDGAVTFPDMVEMLGNTLVSLPNPLMFFLNRIAWALRLSFLSKFPSPALNMATCPWIVSGDRLKKETGFAYTYDSRRAFADFVRQVKKR